MCWCFIHYSHVVLDWRTQFVFDQERLQINERIAYRELNINTRTLDLENIGEFVYKIQFNGKIK